MSLFNHIPINFQQAQLIEKDDSHYYQTPTGDVFPSITTILQKTMSAEKLQSLQNWKEQEPAAQYITQEAATIGTQTHKLVENYLNGITQHRFVDFGLRKKRHGHCKFECTCCN